MRWLTLTLALAVVASACGSSSSRGGFGTGGDDGGISPGDDSGGGFTGSSGGSSGSSGVTGRCDGGSVVTGGTITAMGGPNIVVHGQPASVKLTASAGGTAINGAWNTTNSAIGTVGNDGVFHASGYVGGTVDVILVTCNSQLKITLTVDVDITDNTANLGSSDQTALTTGGPADPTFKYLYPYDQTVFPRGFQPPLLQFGDGKTVTSTANATYLKLTTTHFSYQQFGAGGTPIQVTIPAAVWTGVTMSAGATDPVTAAVTKRTGTTVTGPVTETWHIAPGSLHGFIYYSTYKSILLPFVGNTGGGILRLQPGSTVTNKDIVAKGCVVCHSVSANGTVLAAANGPDTSNPTSSQTMTLSGSAASATPTPRVTVTMGQQFAFAALTPDGTLALTNGVPSNAPPYEPHGFNGGYPSQLVNTMTGAVVSASPLGPHIGQTPAFSPDGKHVAFIDGQGSPTTRPLVMMDFDGTSAFSNLKTLRNETEMTTNACNASTSWNSTTPLPICSAQSKAIAWPSFTPDSAAIIYHLGDSFDSAGFNINRAGDEAPPQFAELRMIEMDGTVKSLNALNGRDANGMSTLPYGASIENNMDYEPNVMPLPVGGYFWVVFTSRRAYGNTIAPGRAATTMMGDTPAQDPFGSETSPSPRKKLWVAAIDVNHAGTTDPSHPAFYLSGQELESANMRAFAALAPCEANGATCETGSDCCNGFCRQTGNDPTTGAPVLACVPPPMTGPTCSNVDEPCKTAADCCDPRDLCINMRCAAITAL
jgi:hypothetical protein